jgi:hypothetical protein
MVLAIYHTEMVIGQVHTIYVAFRWAREDIPKRLVFVCIPFHLVSSVGANEGLPEELTGGGSTKSPLGNGKRMNTVNLVSLGSALMAIL